MNVLEFIVNFEGKTCNIAMERKKNCRYCQKEFIAKRIDAKHCSDSCKQMAYRREKNPDLYGKVVPIFFELDQNDYEELLFQAEQEGLHPNDYVKDIVTAIHEMVHVRFTQDDWSTKINSLCSMHGDISPERLVLKLFRKAAEREFIEFAKREGEKE